MPRPGYFTRTAHVSADALAPCIARSLTVTPLSLVTSSRKGFIGQRILSVKRATQIARFMGSTRGPPGSCRPQVSPMLAPWTLLSGYRYPCCRRLISIFDCDCYQEEVMSQGHNKVKMKCCARITIGNFPQWMRCLSYIVNTMPVDCLATQGANTSAAMVLALFSLNISLWPPRLKNVDISSFWWFWMCAQVRFCASQKRKDCQGDSLDICWRRLQRLEWIPELPPWRPFRFSVKSYPSVGLSLTVAHKVQRRTGNIIY